MRVPPVKANMSMSRSPHQPRSPPTAFMNIYSLALAFDMLEANRIRRKRLSFVVSLSTIKGTKNVKAPLLGMINIVLFSPSSSSSFFHFSFHFCVFLFSVWLFFSSELTCLDVKESSMIRRPKSVVYKSLGTAISHRRLHMSTQSDKILVFIPSPYQSLFLCTQHFLGSG